MKTKWSEMNSKERALTVAYLIVGIITIVLAVLDFADLWEHANVCWLISAAVMSGIECVQYWHKNRKIAILCIVAGVIFAATGIVELILAL